MVESANGNLPTLSFLLPYLRTRCIRVLVQSLFKGKHIMHHYQVLKQSALYICGLVAREMQPNLQPISRFCKPPLIPTCATVHFRPKWLSGLRPHKLLTILKISIKSPQCLLLSNEKRSKSQSRWSYDFPLCSSILRVAHVQGKRRLFDGRRPNLSTTFRVRLHYGLLQGHGHLRFTATQRWRQSRRFTCDLSGSRDTLVSPFKIWLDDYL